MMKKLWTLLAAMLLTVTVSGLTGCLEDEPSTPGDMLEKAAAEHPDAQVPEHPDVQVPKDHPAH